MTYYQVTYRWGHHLARTFDRTTDKGRAFGECYDLQSEGFRARVRVRGDHRWLNLHRVHPPLPSGVERS